MQNLLFWLAAIGFPFFARALPTSSGSVPRIYDVLVPMIQLLMAFGSTYLISRAVKGRAGE